ncbi:helix-turn-helix domain-containing protein [Vibrio maerlii]|uniref:helix-turn-helix domain-containing protein n=1 Tax=Vibrio maerlii TaxID=2231648 RepID=UPI000E3C4A8D|nr:helix-turn-helix domain-containing protein [Vibrio maerlii]
MQIKVDKSIVPLIRCGYAQLLVAGYKELGFDHHTVISDAGLPPRLMELDEQFIPHEPVKKLFSLLAERLSTEQYRKLMLGALQRNSIQRLLGEFRDCKTVGEALFHTKTIYLNDSTNVDVGLERAHGKSWYWCRRKHENTSEFIWSEIYTINYVVELIKALSNSTWQPSKIRVQCRDIEKHKAMISESCMYFVEQDRIEIYVEDEVLGTELRLPPQILKKPLQEQDWHSSFTDKVFTGLYPYMRDTELSIDQASILLKTSSRTLQRKLKEEGTTFRALKDSLMFTCAVEMMTEGLPLTHIATQLSFSDLSQFSRAFKRVSGLSPLRYQRSVLNVESVYY